MTMLIISDDDLVEPPIIKRGSWMETINEVHGIYPQRIEITGVPIPIYAVALELGYDDGDIYNLGVVVFDKEEIKWSKEFYFLNDTNRISTGKSVVNTSSGVVVAGGISVSDGLNVSVATIIKMNATTGAVSWFTSIENPGDGDEWIEKMAAYSDGSLICCGYTWRSDISGVSSISIIKLTSGGDISWSKYIGGTSFEYPGNIVTTSDGGFIVTGRSQSYSGIANDYNALIVKCAANGDLEWAKMYGTLVVKRTEYCEGIQQTTDGGYIAIIGQASGTATSSSRYGNIVKLDSDGVITWNVRWDWGYITTLDQGIKIDVVSDGYIITGREEDSSDRMILKVDTEGVYVWSIKVHDLNNDYPSAGINGNIKIFDDSICFVHDNFDGSLNSALMFAKLNFAGTKPSGAITDLTTTIFAGDLVATDITGSLVYEDYTYEKGTYEYVEATPTYSTFNTEYEDGDYFVQKFILDGTETDMLPFQIAEVT